MKVLLKKLFFLTIFIIQFNYIFALAQAGSCLRNNNKSCLPDEMQYCNTLNNSQCYECLDVDCGPCTSTSSIAATRCRCGVKFPKCAEDSHCPGSTCNIILNANVGSCTCNPSPTPTPVITPTPTPVPCGGISPNCSGACPEPFKQTCVSYAGSCSCQVICGTGSYPNFPGYEGVCLDPDKWCIIDRSGSYSCQPRCEGKPSVYGGCGGECSRKKGTGEACLPDSTGNCSCQKFCTWNSPPCDSYTCKGSGSSCGDNCYCIQSGNRCECVTPTPTPPGCSDLTAANGNRDSECGFGICEGTKRCHPNYDTGGRFTACSCTLIIPLLDDDSPTPTPSPCPPPVFVPPPIDPINPGSRPPNLNP